MMPLSKVFTSTDKLLLFSGLVGLLVYFMLLPRVHPDAAPTFELSEEKILDRAQGFAFNRGYNTNEFEWRATPARSLRLIDSLRENSDGRSLDQILSDPTYDILPAYTWEVIGRKDSDDQESNERIELNLSHTGEIWNFDAKTPQDPAPVRDALLQIPHHASLTEAALDSIETENLTGLLWAIDSSVNASMVSEGDSVIFTTFDAEDAKALAAYYIQKSLLNNYTLSADSVQQLGDPNRNTARVTYYGREETSGIQIKSNVSVTTDGTLKSISTTYSPTPPEPLVQPEPPRPGDGPRGEAEARPAQRPGNNINLNMDNLSDTIQIILMVLLGIFTFILFLRRLNSRLIDVKGAMQDAIWGGLFATLSTGNAVGWSIYQDSASFWIGTLSALGVMLAAGSAGAFAVFIISSATDSIARSVWPKRLSTLTLARNVRFFNIPMGQSMIRSVALAGIFLGAATLILYLPGINLEFTGRHLQGFNTLSPFVSLITGNGLLGMILCMIVLLSIGATLYHKIPRRGVVITVIAILSGFLQLGPLEIEPQTAHFLVCAIIGLVLALTLFRFDFFTCFGSFVLFSILWQVAPHWLLSASSAQVDVTLAFGLIPLILILGWIGLVTQKEVDDVNQFVPTYLKEMAQQERLQSELEIARQVQSSLLPRRMPVLKGVDIAAMCLPAQEVGGDYFDFIKLDEDRTALVIGDVSGKGIQAGFFMTLTKGFLRAICETEDSPAKVLTRVNKLFCQNAPRGTFISLIYGILDTANSTFTFARAGHDPVLYCSTDLDEPIFFKPQGMAIGLTPKSTFKKTIHDETIQLKPSDLLVFYTDGVTEAVNPKMEQFGVERLSQRLASTGLKKSARQVLQEVSEHIQAFAQSAGRADDMTMIVLRVAPAVDLLSSSKVSSKSQNWLEHEL